MAPDLTLPSSPSPAATRTRVKWENVAILLGGAVVASFAVLVVLMQGDRQPGAAVVTPTSHAATESMPEHAGTEPASGLTMTDALGLVEEARQFIAEARWDEAGERLQSVPTELRDVAGATRLAAQLQTSRARHERLRAEVVAAVEARQWKQAATVLTQLAAIAPLDAELQALQATVDQALAPPAAAPRDQGTERGRTSTPVEPAAARTASGGGGSPTRPAVSAPRPAGGSGRPPAHVPAPAATGGRPNASGGAATTPAAIDPLAPIELTPQQEAELAAALGFAAGELK